MDADVAYNVPPGADAIIASYIYGLIFAQLMALEKSIAIGNSTDDPCAGGEVNRVVQGVRIYSEDF